jgi:Tol biopolymer transport system component
MKTWTFMLAAAPVFAQQPATGEMPQELVWVNRQGKVTGRAGQAQMSIFFPEISPDGRYAAVSARDGEANDRDIYIYDLSTGGRRALAPAKGNDNFPIWSVDGKDVVFTSSRTGNYELYRVPFDSTGEPRRILEMKESQYPRGISKDLLIFTHATSGNRRLMSMPLAGGAPAQWLDDTSAWFDGARISPDGKHVAFVSNSAGPWEVYVAETANPRKQWKVSRVLAQGWAGGGGGVRWRGDGKELYYMMGDAMVAVSVQSMGDDFKPGEVKRLFSAIGLRGNFPEEAPWLAKYGVSPDGERFLFVRTVSK